MAASTINVAGRVRRAPSGLAFDFGRFGAVTVSRDELVRTAAERYPELPAADVVHRIDEWLAEGSP